MIDDDTPIIELNAKKIAATAFNPPQVWGTTFGHVTHDHEHVRTVVSRVPEGLLFTTTCACGGRVESLLDLREVNGGLPEVQNMVLDIVAKVEATGWMERHSHCDEAPITWEFSYSMSAWIEMLHGRHSEVIQEGEQVYAAVILVTSDNQALAVPMYDLAEQGQMREIEGDNYELRTIQAAGRLSGLRDTVRANDLDPLFAIHISEAWVGTNPADLPWEDQQRLKEAYEEGKNVPRDLYKKMMSDRKEVMIYVAMTHDFTKMGYAEIKRSSGIKDLGPGVLGAIEWHDGPVSGRLMDGLLATTITPLTGERKENARTDAFGEEG